MEVVQQTSQRFTDARRAAVLTPREFENAFAEYLDLPFLFPAGDRTVVAVGEMRAALVLGADVREDLLGDESARALKSMVDLPSRQRPHARSQLSQLGDTRRERLVLVGAVCGRSRVIPMINVINVIGLI